MLLFMGDVIDGARTSSAISSIQGPRPYRSVVLFGLSPCMNSNTCWVVIYETVKEMCDGAL